MPQIPVMAKVIPTPWHQKMPQIPVTATAIPMPWHRKTCLIPPVAVTAPHPFPPLALTPWLIQGWLRPWAWTGLCWPWHPPPSPRCLVHLDHPCDPVYHHCPMSQTWWWLKRAHASSERGRHQRARWLLGPGERLGPRGCALNHGCSVILSCFSIKIFNPCVSAVR